MPPKAARNSNRCLREPDRLQCNAFTPFPCRLTIQGVSTNLPIEIDPEIMSGAPVFRGTRVPVQSLFEYLEDNQSLDEFLECCPTVRREDAITLLEHSKRELLVQA